MAYRPRDFVYYGTKYDPFNNSRPSTPHGYGTRSQTSTDHSSTTGSGWQKENEVEYMKSEYPYLQMPAFAYDQHPLSNPSSPRGAQTRRPSSPRRNPSSPFEIPHFHEDELYLDPRDLQNHPPFHKELPFNQHNYQHPYGSPLTHIPGIGSLHEPTTVFPSTDFTRGQLPVPHRTSHDNTITMLRPQITNQFQGLPTTQTLEANINRMEHEQPSSFLRRRQDARHREAMWQEPPFQNMDWNPFS
eukprot:29775-Rhodomonas_salina.1